MIGILFHSRTYGVDILNFGDENLAISEGALDSGPRGIHDGADDEILVFRLDHAHQHGFRNLVIGYFADFDTPLFSPAGD